MAMVKHEIMVLACQVSPFHLKLTQINSEMNCVAKHKCTMSQKLDGEKLNATSHMSRATTYTFLDSMSALFSVMIFFVKSVRKSDFHCERKSYSVECLCYSRRPMGDSSPRLDEVQEQQTHIARTIYTCVSFCRVVVL